MSAAVAVELRCDGCDAVSNRRASCDAAARVAAAEDGWLHAPGDGMRDLCPRCAGKAHRAWERKYAAVLAVGRRFLKGS